MKNKANLNKQNRTKCAHTLTELVVRQFEPLQVYQFAKIKQTVQTKSVFTKPVKEGQQVFYLLLIIQSGTTATVQTIQQYLNVNFITAKVIVQVCTPAAIAKCANHANGFLANVLNKGKLRYNNGTMPPVQALKMPNAKKALGRAIVHWRGRSQMANGFFEAAEQALENGHEQVSLFLLHHATEQVCKGLIYVFMGYCPNHANLKNLIYLTACFSKLPLKHFMGTTENEAILHLLMQSVTMVGKNAEVNLANKPIYRFL